MGEILHTRAFVVWLHKSAKIAQINNALMFRENELGSSTESTAPIFSFTTARNYSQQKRNHSTIFCF
jgi:hypothetical protein